MVVWIQNDLLAMNPLTPFHVRALTGYLVDLERRMADMGTEKRSATSASSSVDTSLGVTRLVKGEDA